MFGLTRRGTDHGPTYPGYCPNCDNEPYLHTYAWRTWIHLLGSPLLPWTKTRTLICPICGGYFELTRSEYERAREFSDVTDRFGGGDISESDYRRHLRRFESAVTFLEPPATDRDERS